MMILQQTRGGLSSGDQCSLDLPFAVTKSLTARIGPTPTFTRASAATFIGSDGLIQTATTNTPRFDHDPLTLACRGLLIEESRTNLALHSQDFTASGWTVFGTSVQTVTATNPSGGTTSQKLVESSANVEHGVFRSDAASGTLTMSIFVKEAGRRFCYLRRDLTPNAVFDLVLGTVTQVSGSATASITSAGNGWWRISFTTTEVGNWVIKLSNIGTGVVNNSSYLGDGTSGIFIWGAQLEAGSFPTSYIPTTTASVVRSVDVCSITGSSFTSIWNNTEGTLFAEYQLVSGYSNIGRAIIVIQASDNTFNNLIRVGSATSATNPSLDTSVNTALTRTTSSSAFSISGINKTSAAYIAGNNSISHNGSSSATGFPSSIATVLNRLDIGKFHEAAANLPLSGTITAIRYYKRRLPNAKLQALTV